MKRVTLLIAELISALLLLTILTGCECSRKDPLRQAVESSFNYLKQGNYNEYVSYFDLSDRKAQKMKDKVKTEIERKKGIEKFKIYDPAINPHNTRAEVKIAIEYKDGSRETISTYWKKDNKKSGRWVMQVENAFFGGRW